MKYEKPIINISMFKAESIAVTGDGAINGSVVAQTNLDQAIAVARTRNANVNKALVVIKFND